MQAIVRTILNRVLGPYFDFQGDIDVDLWTGRAVLRHIMLREQAVNETGIALHVNACVIDRIEFVCDWRGGFSKPVEVDISHVYMSATPRKNFADINRDQLRETVISSRRASKQARLQSWENRTFDPDLGFVGRHGKAIVRAQRKRASLERGEEPTDEADFTLDSSSKNLSTVERIVSKIVANLKVRVRHVHVRLEMDGLACGLRLRELYLCTTDENFKPSVVSGIEDALFKCLSLDRLFVYLNTGDNVGSTMLKVDLEENEAPPHEPQYRYVMHTEMADTPPSFVMNPISFQLRVTMHQDHSASPRIKVDFDVEKVQFALSQEQYRAAMLLAGAVDKASSHLKVLLGKDLVQERPSNLDVLDKEYMELYKKSLYATGCTFPDLTLDESARLAELEMEHTAKEIETYRKIVLSELDEALARAGPSVKYEIFRKSDRKAPGLATRVLSWFTASRDVLGDIPVDAALHPPEIEDLQHDSSEEQIVLALAFRLPEVSLTIMSGDFTLVRLGISDMRADATASESSTIGVDLSLQDAFIHNSSLPEVAFPEILYRSSAEPVQTDSVTSVAKLHIGIEPAGSNIGVSVSGGIEPLDLIVDQSLIQRLTRFLEKQGSPSSATDDAAAQFTGDASEEDGGETMVSTVTAAIASTSPEDIALFRRPSMIIELKMSAPTMIVPECSSRSDTPCLVIDLGSFLISTAPAASKAPTTGELQGITAAGIHDLSNPLYTRFYDRLSLDVTQIELFFAAGGQQWRSHLKDQRECILRPIDITLQVGICVLIDSDVLPSLTFDMNVLPFDIRISPKQVHRLVVMAQDFRTEPDSLPTNDVPASTSEDARHEPISPMSKDQAAVPVYTEKERSNVLAMANISFSGLSLTVASEGRDIVSAGLSTMSLNVTKRVLDMDVKAAIAEFAVHECLSDIDFVRSRSSLPGTMPDNPSASQAFLGVHYLQCRPESPLFQGFENSISVEAGQVEVILEPLTLYDTAVVMMSLIEFGRPLSRPGSLPASQRQENYASQPSTEAPTPSTEAPSPSTSFKAMFGGAIIRLLANPLSPVITASLGNVAGAYSRFSDNTQEFTFAATSISMEDFLVEESHWLRHPICMTKLRDEETPYLIDVHGSIAENRVNLFTRASGLRINVRCALIKELLDITRFSAIPKLLSLVPKSEHADSDESSRSGSPLSSLVWRDTTFDIALGGLQLAIAKDKDETDALKATLADVVLKTDGATLGRVSGIFVGFGNAGLDEFTEELLDVSFLEMRIDNESHVAVQSSPMIFSAGREQFDKFIDCYNSDYRLAPTRMRTLYGIQAVDDAKPLPPELASQLPELNITIASTKLDVAFVEAVPNVHLKSHINIRLVLHSLERVDEFLLVGCEIQTDASWQSPAAWDVVAGVQKLQMDRKAKDAILPVLHPIDCSLQATSGLSSLGASKFILANITMKPIHLVVSYSAVLLLNSTVRVVQDALASIQPVGEANPEQKANMDDSNIPKIEILDEESLAKGSSVESQCVLSRWALHESVGIGLESIRIDIVNDCFGGQDQQRIPVAELIALVDSRSQVYSFGYARHLFIGMWVAVRYFNTSNSSYEPLIEPSRISVRLTQTASSTEATMAIEGVMDINITAGLVDSLMYSVQLIRKETDTAGSPRSRKSSDRIEILNRNRLTIQNHTEAIVTVLVSTLDSVPVDPGSSCELPLQNSQDGAKVSLSFGPEWTTIAEVDVSRTGCQSFWLHREVSAKSPLSTVRVFVDTSELGMSKVLDVHSAFCIRNRTKSIMVVESKDVAPDETYWLPVSVRDSNLQLVVSLKDSKLSRAVLNLANGSTLLRFKASDETYDLMVGVVYKRGVDGLHEFIFTPPLILQNLLTLPCQVRIRKAGSQKGFETEALESEDELPLMVVSPEDTFHFEIMLPFMSKWSKPVTIGPSSQAPSLACVDASNSYTLVVQAELTSSRLLLYVPYWIYDMTSLPGGDCLSVSADKSILVPPFYPPADIDSQSDADPKEPLRQPLMFNSSNGRCHVRLSKTNLTWSEAVAINAAGSSDFVSIIAGRQCFQFNVTVALCSAPFTRTKKVIFSHRFVLFNGLPFSVSIKQFGSGTQWAASLQERFIIHSWPDRDLKEMLTFKFDGDDNEWCSPVSVQGVLDDTIYLRSARDKDRLVRVQVQCNGVFSNFIVLSCLPAALAPITVINRTAMSHIWFRQKSTNQWLHVPPGERCPYAWDDKGRPPTITLKLDSTMTRSGEPIDHIEFDWSLPREETISVDVNDPVPHSLIASVKVSGYKRTICIQEKIRNMRSLAESQKVIHQRLANLVSQWSAKKLELSLLQSDESEDTHGLLFVDMVESSNMEAPKHSAVYGVVSYAGVEKRTQITRDFVDPFWDLQVFFGTEGNVVMGPLTISFFASRGAGKDVLLGGLVVPLGKLGRPSDLQPIDRWFPVLGVDKEVRGRVHIRIRYLHSRLDALRESINMLDKDIANQQATLARLAKLLEAAAVPHQPEPTHELEEPTQAIVPAGKERTSASLKSAPRIIEFTLSVVDVRGPVLSSALFLDAPPDNRAYFDSVAPLKNESGQLLEPVPAASADSGVAKPVSMRLLCRFAANVPGPDEGLESVSVVTDYAGNIISGMLRQPFVFRTDSSVKAVYVGSTTNVRLALLMEILDHSSNTISYEHVSSGDVSLAKDSDECWIKLADGSNEICISLSSSELPNGYPPPSTSPTTNLNLFLAKLGISLVDSVPAELAYISMSNMHIGASLSDDGTGFFAVVENAQVDNQNYSALFPVVIARRLPVASSAMPPPLFQLSMLSSSGSQTLGFINLEFFNVLLQEVDVLIEEDFVIDLFHFVTRVYDTVSAEMSVDERRALSFEESMQHPVSESSSNLFVKRLLLHPIAINLTLHPTLRPHRAVVSDSRWTTPVDVLLGAAGITFAAVNGAPIRISSFEINDVFGSRDVILAPVKRHYIVQMLRQVYKVLGSLSVLGDPVGLVSNIGTGVKHLVYDPAQGIVSSPLEFGKGLASGSREFVRHTVGGVLSSASQITSSISSGLSALTMDKEYLMQREHDARQRVREASQGTETHNIGTGLMALGSGVFGGITGIVKKPVEGARAGGPLGFLKGIAQGSAGLIAKPVVGLVDFGTHTVQGLQNVVGGPNAMFATGRSRRPRYIPKVGVLSVYNAKAARGQAALRMSQSLLVTEVPVLTEDQLQQEVYVDSSHTFYESKDASKRKAMLVLISNFRLLVGKTRQGNAEQDIELASIRFSLFLQHIRAIELSSKPDGVSVRVGSNKQTIKCGSPEEAQDLFGWLERNLQQCTPHVQSAQFGIRTFIDITSELQALVSASLTAQQEPRLTPRDIRTSAQNVYLKSADNEFDFDNSILLLEYSRGPATVSAQFDLSTDVVL